MNIQHLRYFLKMMEIGSVSRAAEQLGITQPTLSVALKGLETEFGAPLFAPEGRGLRPLPSAKQLEQYATKALQALVEAKRDLSKSAPDRLRIGVMYGMTPNWLAATIKAWPGPVQVIEASMEDLQKYIRNETVDVALTTSPDKPTLPHHIILREPFKLFVGPAHELARESTVALGHIHQLPFVLRQSCERLGTARRIMDCARVRFRIVAKVKQEATAATLVASGLGATIAPRSWAFSGLKSLKVTDFPLDRAVALFWKSALGKSAKIKILDTLEDSIIAPQ